MERRHNALSSEGISQCLKLLSDPTRLLMLKLLEDKEYCVCELTAIFHISQPGISQHLRKLKNAGLVRERREASGGTMPFIRPDRNTRWFARFCSR